MKQDDASREEPIPVIVWNVIASSMMIGQADGGEFKRAGLLKGCHVMATGQGERADERSCDVTMHEGGGGGEKDAAAITLNDKRVRCLNCWSFI